MSLSSSEAISLLKIDFEFAKTGHHLKNVNRQPISLHRIQKHLHWEEVEQTNAFSVLLHTQMEMAIFLDAAKCECEAIRLIRREIDLHVISGGRRNSI